MAKLRGKVIENTKYKGTFDYVGPQGFVSARHAKAIEARKRGAEHEAELEETK